MAIKNNNFCLFQCHLFKHSSYLCYLFILFLEAYFVSYPLSTYPLFFSPNNFAFFNTLTFSEHLHYLIFTKQLNTLFVFISIQKANTQMIQNLNTLRLLFCEIHKYKIKDYILALLLICSRQRRELYIAPQFMICKLTKCPFQRITI